MQEDVEHRTATMIVNGSKFTGRLLKNAIAKLLGQRKNPRQQSKDVIHRGKQSVKQLIGQNQGVSNLEIKDQGVKEFERIARKYGVDFAVKKIKGLEGEKPKYLVFFKARDADALTSAFTEFTRKKVRGQERPPIRKVLAQIKALVPGRGKEPVKNKDKELSR